MEGLTGEFGVVAALSMVERAAHAGRLFRRLRNDLLAPGGSLLVTVSMGLDPALDDLLLAGEIGPVVFYRRVGE